jgi:hypothetical protein
LHLRAVAEREPELAAYLALKAFFLHGELGSRRTRAGDAAAEARWRRRDKQLGLLEELRAGGELDSSGRFTLDRAQARAKMQKFQLVDARRYVLELVQAAVLRGATAIAFDIDADDMHMRFDGQVFTGRSSASCGGRSSRTARSGCCGGAAAGAGAERGAGAGAAADHGAQRRASAGAASRARTSVTAIEPAVAGTTIHVEQRVRLGLVGLFFKNLGGRWRRRCTCGSAVCTYAAWRCRSTG